MPGYDTNNVFAKILRGELPSQKVYEDADTLAIMDIMPRCQGHTLVIPKTPARNLLDASPTQLAACMKTVQKVANAVMKAFKADGITLHAVQRAGRRAGGVPPAFPRAAALGRRGARPAYRQDGKARGARGQRREDQGRRSDEHGDVHPARDRRQPGHRPRDGEMRSRRPATTCGRLRAARPRSPSMMPELDEDRRRCTRSCGRRRRGRRRGRRDPDARRTQDGAGRAGRHHAVLQGDAHPDRRHAGGGRAPAGDGHGHGRRRQPRARRLPVRCPDVPAGPEAHLRRQGRAGADDPRQRPGVDHRPARPADRRRRDRPDARAGRSARTGRWARSRAPTWPTSWCARRSSAATSARRRC